MAKDDRSDRGGCGRSCLQTLGSTESVQRQQAHPFRNLGRSGSERVVVLQFDPKHARRLRCAESARVEHAEGDRHLPEDVTWPPFADHTFHAVDAPEHLEPTVEDAEQCPSVTLVHSGLAGNKRDVRHCPGEPVELGRLEVREHRDLTDLLRRHHEMHHLRRLGIVLS